MVFGLAQELLTDGDVIEDGQGGEQLEPEHDYVHSSTDDGGNASCDENLEAAHYGLEDEVTEELSSSACGSDSSEEEEDENHGDDRILHEIMIWAASGIPHTKLSQLLVILGKHRCFQGWPSDARTLLNTPRKTQTHQVAGGEYHHWGMENKVVHIWRHLKS